MKTPVILQLVVGVVVLVLGYLIWKYIISPAAKTADTRCYTQSYDNNGIHATRECCGDGKGGQTCGKWNVQDIARPVYYVPQFKIVIPPNPPAETIS